MTTENILTMLALGLAVLGTMWAVMYKLAKTDVKIASYDRHFERWESWSRKVDDKLNNISNKMEIQDGLGRHHYSPQPGHETLPIRREGDAG